jgi:hypothetical protein
LLIHYTVSVFLNGYLTLGFAARYLQHGADIVQLIQESGPIVDDVGDAHLHLDYGRDRSREGLDLNVLLTLLPFLKSLELLLLC